MLPGDTAALRKARGAFFTPGPLAKFIADWSVRSPVEAVLEPSAGEAVFLHAVGSRGTHRGRLVGVELHESSAAEAARALEAAGINAEIHVGDFFEHREFEAYDAVIGNPPYVRYQDFTGSSRLRAREAALRGGVSLTSLASSWAAFTVHSALQLKRGGRLGLVLPAELLTVNYAAGVRQFLLDHFSEVSLVLFEERVFPGILEEVVLLLADGYSPAGGTGADHMLMTQVRDAAGLPDLPVGRRWTPPSRSGKWSGGLLSEEGLAASEKVATSSHFTVLETWGDTTLGMVTGNNKFFTLSPAKVAELGLRDSDLIRLSPPGSRHLRALTLTSSTLDALGRDGRSAYLFRPENSPSPQGWRYIASGEALDVHEAYKCRVRSPWWRVPYLRPADLFLTYMNADTPRLATNRARAHHLNSVHGLYLRDHLRTTGMSLLPLASLNSATLLAAETVGRAYGGGMLKIEPREADSLPVPAPELVYEHRDALNRTRRLVTAHLQAGRLLDAVAVVDEVLLLNGLGLSNDDLRALRVNHAQLTARRVARGKERRQDA